MNEMLLTPQHQERLRDALRENPLKAGEMRHIDWAGEQYIALETTSVSEAEYTKLYTLKIDEVRCVVYARLSNTSSSN